MTWESYIYVKVGHEVQNRTEHSFTYMAAQDMTNLSGVHKWETSQV